MHPARTDSTQRRKRARRSRNPMLRPRPRNFSARVGERESGRVGIASAESPSHSLAHPLSHLRTNRGRGRGREVFASCGDSEGLHYKASEDSKLSLSASPCPRVPASVPSDYLRERSDARPMRCIVLFQSSGFPSGPRGMAGMYLPASKSSHVIAGRSLSL